MYLGCWARCIRFGLLRVLSKLNTQLLIMGLKKENIPSRVYMRDAAEEGSGVDVELISDDLIILIWELTHQF